ncbi:MAG TPA: RsmE family RNA methyltransferase [Chitinophagaceae bacterium]|nr:RsmE family RNA methyltransferase [Chitinophagaceae bacterium]
MPATEDFILSEESSRHIVQVLRMSAGGSLIVTNGKGETLTVKIVDANKKKTRVAIIERNFFQRSSPQVSIAIGLIKNKIRFEWFIEKAAEIGVTDIYPLLTKRTEKQSFNQERIRAIAVSAMLQSQQAWLTEVHAPRKLDELIKNTNQPQKFIAHCADGEKEHLSKKAIKEDSFILIGPEGDFSREEIMLATEHNFIPVSLGDTRLRTETAGIAAAVLMCIK